MYTSNFLLRVCNFFAKSSSVSSPSLLYHPGLPLLEDRLEPGREELGEEGAEETIVDVREGIVSEKEKDLENENRCDRTSAGYSVYAARPSEGLCAFADLVAGKCTMLMRSLESVGKDRMNASVLPFKTRECVFILEVTRGSER